MPLHWSGKTHGDDHDRQNPSRFLEEVYDYEAGKKDWREAGLPVES
jgi:hypothetical protein